MFACYTAKDTKMGSKKMSRESYSYNIMYDHILNLEFILGYVYELKK